jgi:hypothetical protein
MKLDGVAGTGLIWLGIGTGDGRMIVNAIMNLLVP